MTKGHPGDVLGATVLGPSDVWASGFRPNTVEHWNGHRWRAYRVPGQGVQAFAGISHRDVWAIAPNSTDDQFEALRWNGRRWHQVHVPPATLPANGQSLPAAIAATSRNSVWAVGAVGYPDPVTGLRDAMPVAYRWNGASWKHLAIPPSLYHGIKQGSAFTEVASAPGGFRAGLGTQGLSDAVKLVHYRAGRWSVVKLPAISGSVLLPVPPNAVCLADIPGTSKLWVPVQYIARSGQYHYSIYLHQ